METQKIVWLLSPKEHFGFVPQCALVNIKEDQMELKFSIITSKNKQNYIHLLDETELILLRHCIQLEENNIRSKIIDKQAISWEEFAKKYLNHHTNSKEILKIREYLKDIINSYLNKFYENIADKPIYFFKGDIPSLWKKIYFDDSNPEIFYHFNYTSEGIKYHLKITKENKEFNITNGVLLTHSPARILLKNTVYQFENEINGNSLIPFFKKQNIEIQSDKAEDYLSIFVQPLLLKTKKVIAEGFKIFVTDTIPRIVLEVTSIQKQEQLSMFDDTSDADENYKIKFELFFFYNNYRFKYGIETNTVFLNSEKNAFIFNCVERNYGLEKEIVESIFKLGINLKHISHLMTFEDGMNWLNSNFEKIENLGIEIIQSQKKPNQKVYFIGQSSITAYAKETIDWFETSGKVHFGEYSFSLKVIIVLIKQNKTEIRLPNGEYAIFPKNWIQEYSILGTYSKIVDDKILTSKHHFVMMNILNLNGSLKIDLNSRLKSLLDTSTIEQQRLPKGFNGTLRDYQIAGFNWLVFLNKLNLGGVLADDMGLGKTIQTLCLLQWQKENKKGASLLIVPKTLLYNWEREAKTFCPELKIHAHYGQNRNITDEIIENHDIILTTYAILRIDIEAFANHTFNYCILDESQYIKNPQSAIANACMQLKAKHFLTLSGTPIENSMNDLWTQMHFVNRNILGSISQFQKEYLGEEKIQLLKKIIHPFILRRLKSSVAKDLPEKSISSYYCEMDNEQLEFYRQIKNQYRHSILHIHDDHSKVKFNLLEGLLRMRQLANHPKLYDKTYSGESGKFNTVCEMLELAVLSKHKVLVYSSFTEYLKLFKAFLEEQKISYCYLDGQTKDREHQVTLFQTNSDYKIFLLSLKAGGLGLNLTQAEYVFLLDPWWNPAAEAQAYDRAHRIGQTKNVFVYKFITRDSIEEKIMELQNKKIKLSESLIQSEDGFIKSLNKEDIEYLLS